MTKAKIRAFIRALKKTAQEYNAGEHNPFVPNCAVCKVAGFEGDEADCLNCAYSLATKGLKRRADYFTPCYQLGPFTPREASGYLPQGKRRAAWIERVMIPRLEKMLLKGKK